MNVKNMKTRGVQRLTSPNSIQRTMVIATIMIGTETMTLIKNTMADIDIESLLVRLVMLPNSTILNVLAESFVIFLKTS